MSDIIIFTPKAELAAQEDLSSFISLCRNNPSVFGKDLDFDEDLWDVTKDLGRKGMGNKHERIRFSNLKTAKMTHPDSMDEAFKDLAKSYIRYLHGLRSSKSIGHRLEALRVLEGNFSAPPMNSIPR